MNKKSGEKRDYYYKVVQLPKTMTASEEQVFLNDMYYGNLKLFSKIGNRYIFVPVDLRKKI